MHAWKSWVCMLGMVVALPVRAQTTVEQFSPTGTVKQIRQVTARFSADMVPFGDLRLTAPFAVDCAAPGQGRWIDSRNWSYDFEQDLPAGVACSFTLKAQQDLAGKPLAGVQRFAFNTGGPAVVRMAPGEGMQVDENQIFVLGLDAPATDDSVLAHAWCRVENVGEKIGVRLLQGKERDDVLALRKNFVDSHVRLYLKTRAGLRRVADVANRAKIRQEMPVAVVQCRRTLPANTQMALVWDAGIRTPSGIATTEAQPLAFRTRPDFSLSVHCQRMKTDGPCIPFLPVGFRFSAPVKVEDARRIKLTAPSGKDYLPQFDPSESKAGSVDYFSIPGPFPVKAALKLSVPADLRDDAGRELVNRGALPAAMRTGDNPPLIKFPSRFGILEAKGDRLLPVTVRSVETKLATSVRSVPAPGADGAILRVPDRDDAQIIDWLLTLSGSRYTWEPGEQWRLDRSVFGKDAKTERITLPRPRGKRQFEVLGIPLAKPGFYVVEVASPVLGAALHDKPVTAYVSAAALVTNLAAHFKHGAESSLVWVTTLDRGRPVRGADVSVRDCAGRELWKGRTDGNGVARIARELNARCDGGERYFISARSGDDMTFTLSTWDRGIESWRFNVRTESRDADPVIATTVFDRTLLRAGETVHMKHFLRQHAMSGIEIPSGTEGGKKRADWRARALKIADSAARPANVFLLHQGTDEKVELPITWNANATAESSWTIPPTAKLGTYEVMLGGRSAGSFRVEQFRVPTMRGVIQPPKERLIAPAVVPLDLQLSYLSGGAASLAQVKLRTVLEPRGASFADYGSFTFSNGDVKEGTEKSSGTFDEDDWMEGAEGAEGEAAPLQGMQTRQVNLDKGGGARVQVDKLPALGDQPKELLAEMSYQDANGETLTVSRRVPLWPSGVVVGIKPDGWWSSQQGLRFQAVVLDVDGKPVADTPVTIDYFKRETYSHRRRLLGGFYSYENTSEVKHLGSACSGRTDAKGLLFCDVKPEHEGNLILRARAQDAQERPAFAHVDVWVAGNADWWFSHSDNDRIDVLSAKKRFEPGETASFQVRSPFREATALVTVEREGVLDTYVRRLRGKEPVFTIPMKPNYAPNVFVSTLVVRGRVAGVQPTALVDLGKPAYKLGITPVRVGWAAHELKVDVHPERTVYKVREKAAVAIHVTRADGSKPPAGTEVAIAAVDEGLLELMPNTSWDLLETMMQERGLQVQTATAQMQVIGKRHFGRKAFPHGGGGGRSSGRELFDTLLFWKARVTLDANGDAQVQVPLNDSLTSFRIVAIANGAASLFGTGHAAVRSTQDLMLMSGLPALVRSGDRFHATYTLRNASDHALAVTLRAAVAPDNGRAETLPARKLTLAAGESREVGWDYTVPQAASLAWDASAETEGAADRIKVKQEVKAAVPVRTLQATLLRLDRARTVPVRMPADAVPGRGGIVTRLSPRIADEMPGVREYMLDYPYTCFEQTTSRAIALGDDALWEKNMEALPAYLDGDGLVKYFTLSWYGSDTLTAYVLSVANESGRAIPDALRGRMTEGLANFVRGKVVRYSALPTADVAVRKVAALEALSRYGLVAPDMLESFTIAPNLWPTEAVINWYLVMERTPALPQRDTQRALAERILRARLNLQGTTMGFSTERTDNWWWLMMSADVNANRLLLAMLDNPSWQADMGRLARGALGRQRKGKWQTTIANAWGVLAMGKFSDKFESEPVGGATSVALAGQSRSFDWERKANGQGGALTLPWPKGTEDLKLRHDGSGKPWAVIQSTAAIPLKEPLSTGFRITRTITPVERRQDGVWSRGDIYRVHLDLEAQADMTWVVVDDPIPASATVLGGGLGRDSQIGTRGERQRGWVWPAFEERGFQGFHAYYEFVPKGKWSVEYTVRLNNAGRFALPPTRVEAMYNPEMFGAVPNAPVTVNP